MFSMPPWLFFLKHFFKLNKLILPFDMLKNLDTFQKRILALLAVALLTSFGIIIALLIVLHVAEGRLEKIGATMDEMAVQHIISTVTVEEVIPLNSDITIKDEMTVGINMMVETTVPFKAMIPVNDKMMVPIRIGVKDYIRIDTTIQIKDAVNITVNDTIPLNQKMKMPIFGKRGPNIPISGKIPLNQKLHVSFNELMNIHSVVPIDLLIVDTLPIGLSMRIPVDLMVPIKIPIHSTAKIHFTGPMAVDAKIPIKLTIPVNIPLEETSLAAYFRKMAEGLRGLTKLALE